VKEVQSAASSSTDNNEEMQTCQEAIDRFVPAITPNPEKHGTDLNEACAGLWYQPGFRRYGVD